MKRISILFLALVFALNVLTPMSSVSAKGQYEIHNDLLYPVTVDIYRIYFEKSGAKFEPVHLETVYLDEKGGAKDTHTCDFTKTNDGDIVSYQYRIQYKTPQYYSKLVPEVVHKLNIDTSTVIKPENRRFGYYRFPSLLS